MIAAAALAAAAAVPAGATDVVGAGATFPYPIYARWAAAYKEQSGVALNYQSIGSGGGIKQIQAGTVDFGASDKPLRAEELERHGLVQFPLIVGGVVPVVNLPGVGPGGLRLTGPVLARIYLGEITKWNDPALSELNPGLALPDRAITVVYRSDGSGTTFIYTDYLSRMSPRWKSEVGSETAVAWPVGIGGKGNEGVASYVSRIAGAIGYVEHAYLIGNRLAYATLDNRAGRRVAPTRAAFAAAASHADWAAAPGFHQLLTDQPGEESWPITGASFILMRRSPKKPEAARAALGFFDWAYRQGGAMAEQLDYVPMPEALLEQVEAAWAEIRDPVGKPVRAGAR